MKINDLYINGDYKLYPLIDAYFKFLGGENKASFQFTNINGQYYIEKDNTIEITTLNYDDTRIKNILDIPFYIRGSVHTQEIFNKLGIVNDSRFDCNVNDYIYYIENSTGECKIIGGLMTHTKIGEFIKNNWFDATDVLIEILINDKPKSIEEFNKLYNKECYNLENEAELLTKLLQISCIYNNNEYPDWTTNTTKYVIKCCNNELTIKQNVYTTACIAFDKQEYAEEYLKVFEKDLEKVKYWL